MSGHNLVVDADLSDAQKFFRAHFIEEMSKLTDMYDSLNVY